jgi:hypothetical protein
MQDMQIQIQSVITYLLNVGISIDQLANALLAGDPDETLSSRCGKQALGGCRLCAGFCWLLGLLHRNHCTWAIERDRGDKV